VRARQWFPPEAWLSKALVDLQAGNLEVLGLVRPASNETYLCRLPSGMQCAYKPISGERALWDFPDGTLAHREHSAWLVSQALGWGIVPETVLRDGPFGMGVVQRWIDTAKDSFPALIVEADQLPQGYLTVLEAIDAEGRQVVLAHEESSALFRMAIFDLITNNTDRKGGHILAQTDGQRFGIDHGLCFHHSDKLRTILWGFSDRLIPDDYLEALTSLLEQLDAELGAQLELALTSKEVAALGQRVRRTIQNRVMPRPASDWPALPWPPM